MRILYVANIRMPTERAHGVQIVKTCEAFVQKGASVVLVVPDRVTKIKEDVAAYYGLRTQFPITRVKVFDIVSWGFFGFVLETFSFAISAVRCVRTSTAIVYSRDEVVLAFIALFTSREMVWESHTGSWNIFARYVARRAKRVVVITQGLCDLYVQKGIPKEKLIVAHDGIDLEEFQNSGSREEARMRLHLPLDAKIALYIGSIGGWKGTDTLFKASEDIAEAVIAVIGAVPPDIRARYPRVLFCGEKPYRDIARNLQAADIVVLPSSGQSTIGAHYTSPLKLFAYMASGIPIVASEVASTREVLPHDAAFWFKSDDAVDLAHVISGALHDQSRHHKAQIAKAAVSLYTWNERAQRILSSL